MTAPRRPKVITVCSRRDNADNFTFRLADPVFLPGSWTVQLVDLQIWLGPNKERASLIAYGSLCDMAEVEGKKVPLLDIITVKNTRVVSRAGLKMRVWSSILEEIRIWFSEKLIKDGRDAKPSFLPRPSRCSLLLEPCTDNLSEDTTA